MMSVDPEVLFYYRIFSIGPTKQILRLTVKLHSRCVIVVKTIFACLVVVSLHHKNLNQM